MISSIAYDITLHLLYDHLPEEIKDRVTLYGINNHEQCLFQIRTALAGVAFGYHIYYFISPTYPDYHNENEKYYRFGVELNIYSITPERFEKFFYINLIRFLLQLGQEKAKTFDPDGGDLGRESDNYK